MKKRLLAIVSVSAISLAAIGLVAHFASKDASSVFGDGANEDYALVLNSTTNVIHSTVVETKDYFRLSNEENIVDVLYNNYYQVDDAWGKLLDSGYFGLYRDEKTSERIGGLTSVHYSTNKDLVIEYGYQESGKPTYYSAPLPSGINTFSFPEGQGYPDTFKISNASGEEAIITAMTFYYTCNQTDQHVHVPTGEITRTTDDGVKYWQSCDICGAQSEVDLSSYKIKIGTNSEDLVTYDPYNYASYADASRAGSLDFDYNNSLSDTKRFVLTLDGDNASKNIYIDSNVANSQIFIKSQNNASIHDITFKGGYGVLLFTGEKLTLVNGNVNSEAIYTTVKGPLSFEDTRKIKDAITISNGQLALENDVDITGYNVGIRLGRSLTGSKDIHQNSGTVNITNCDIAVAARTGAYAEGEYRGVARIRSTFKISSCRLGFFTCGIEVGDETRTGKLLVDVDSTRAGDGRAAGMQIDHDDTINFVKGQAAFYATNGKANTSAIKITNGWKNGMLTVAASGFEYGFANLDRGFDGEPTPVYDNDYSNTNADTFFYCFDAGAFDLGSYCGTKPTGTQLSGTDFNTKFGI